MKKISIAFTCMMLSRFCMAETLWSDFSLTYLNGSNYEVGDPEREVATFEYVAGTSWGGVFFFVDRLESDNGDTETYGEFTPRATLYSFDEGSVFETISTSATIEFGDGFTNYLYGIGLELDVPGFNYFNFDVYRRNNDFGEDNWQLTVVWGIPFNIGSTEWKYDGFIDWASAIPEQQTGANMNFTSQLKWNLAPYFSLKHPLYIGLEYVYWNDKFGISGVNERNANLLVKWHF